MPLNYDRQGARSLRQKLNLLFDNLHEDFTEIGSAAADAIVQTTLGGVAAGDGAFKPYSEGYRQTIEAVGGKATGVVDLRGVFYPPGAGPKVSKDSKKELARQKRELRKGAERRGYVRLTLGGKTFFAKTKLTRPRVGAVDKFSEMSRDLIKVEALQTKINIIYTPRKAAYMVWHNETRHWFSLDKTLVREAVYSTANALFKARIDAFNNEVS